MFSNQTKLFDSHCHLNAVDFNQDRELVVNNAVQAGVKQIIDVGIDLKSAYLAIENALQFEPVLAAVGIDPQVLILGGEGYDPNYLDKGFVQQRIADLDDLIKTNRKQIGMVGETGLDAYWLEKERLAGNITKKEMTEHLTAQQYLFELHLELAQRHKLPVTVHSRGAETLTIDQIIQKTQSGASKVGASTTSGGGDAPAGIFHSYTGDYPTAKKILDAGWALGVNAIATFKTANQLRKVYIKILGRVSQDWSPADFYQKGIFFETDAPYLSPHPHRGTRNQPAYLHHTFQQFKALLAK